MADCPQIPLPPPPLEVTFPGGATISAVVSAGSEIPDKLAAATSVLQQASGALAPLTPLFRIIDAVMAIKTALEAVPDAITSLDPGAITSALVAVAEKTALLAPLVPQLSMPLTIVGVLDCIIAFLGGASEALDAVVTAQEQIAIAAARAAELGDDSLADVADCASENIVRQLQAMAAALGPINQLIGLINVFMSIIGLDPIPTLDGTINPADVAASNQALQDAVTLLQGIRDSIPLP